MERLEAAELGVVSTSHTREALQLKWRRRRLLPRLDWVPAEPDVYEQDEWTIDGQPLRTILASLSSSLSENRNEYASPLSLSGDPRDAVSSLKVLLGGQAPQFEGGRSIVFVCSHDFDSFCRAVTAVVTFESDEVLWSSLRLEFPSIDDREEPIPIGFRFRRGAYEQTLRELLQRYTLVLEDWMATGRPDDDSLS